MEYFAGITGTIAVDLPIAFTEVAAGWDTLRGRMIRERPAAFTREEWAYLIEFLSRERLGQVPVQTFGPLGRAAGPVRLLVRPRSPIAVWLPNNVSLLGPLLVPLLSLTGSRVRFKSGSRADDLTSAFLDYALGSLPPGPLAEHLGKAMRVEQFDRDDPRNTEWSEAAAVRVVFGSDDAIQNIAALPHPVGSVLIPFADHQSEAWIEPSAVTDSLLTSLIRVFAIYGQAGCTSPRRVLLLGADRATALDLRDHLANLWPTVITRQPAMHLASENLLVSQWASAVGWEAKLVSGSAATLLVGGSDVPEVAGLLTLTIISTTPDEAAARASTNLQTIGHGLSDPTADEWLARVARTPAKRFVPIAQMHHFGPVWDGMNYWSQLFEWVEVQV